MESKICYISREITALVGVCEWNGQNDTKKKLTEVYLAGISAGIPDTLTGVSRCFPQVSQGRCRFNTSIRQWPLPLRPFHFILHYHPIIRLHSLMTELYHSLYPKSETLIHRKVYATVVLLLRHFAVYNKFYSDIF
jgi:hypothetical protein